MYNEDSFIYLTGYKLVGKNIAVQIGIDLYRTLIGFVGSIFFIMLWQYVLMMVNRMSKKDNSYVVFRMLRHLGAHSMGIYILSGYVIIFIIQRLAFIEKPSYIVNVIETVAVLAITLPIAMLLEKIPVLKKFIGK